MPAYSKAVTWNGILILGFAASVGSAVLSHAFHYGVDPAQSPLPLYIALGVAAGLVLVALRAILPHQTVGPSIFSDRRVMAMLVAGLMMRLAMFGSLPVIEDDSYRYFWDGAVVAQGIDPYAHAPTEAAPFDWQGEPIATEPGSTRATLQALAVAHPEMHARINFPWIKTIYPPVAQAGFLVAHQIAPFDLNGWRVVLLFSDLSAIALMMLVLRRMGRSPVWAALYWLNPVVVMQGFGAGHMDILLAPFLLAALLAAFDGRAGWAGAALGGAVAVKIWPLLLAPALAAWFWRDRGALVRFAVAAGAMLMLLVPQLMAAQSPDAGIVAYSESWQRHAFLFPMIADGLGVIIETGDLAARTLVALTVGGLALVLAGRVAIRAPFNTDTRTRMLITALVVPVLALLFLSPTGYPWYLIWLAVLLPFTDSRAALALFVTAPLYQFRFIFGDDDAFYLSVVVPISFGLPLIALVLEATQHRKEHVHAI